MYYGLVLTPSWSNIYTVSSKDGFIPGQFWNGICAKHGKCMFIDAPSLLRMQIVRGSKLGEEVIKHVIMGPTSPRITHHEGLWVFGSFTRMPPCPVHDVHSRSHSTVGGRTEYVLHTLDISGTVVSSAFSQIHFETKA